jgi:polyferredoxin
MVSKSLNHDSHSEVAQGKLPVFFAMLLTALSLSIVQIRVERPMILLERFFTGWGWLEIIFLSAYSGFVTGKLLDPLKSAKWRGFVWSFFSIIFFTQLLIGLLGFERFLMSGKLHLPIPALIVAGPLYRGSDFFMVTLFAISLILIGPAWCSYVCYIGSWDFIASRKLKRPRAMPRWRQLLRVVILFLVVSVALGLRVRGAPAILAVIFASVFGLIGIGVIALFSTRGGQMVHCIVYCPIGLLANIFGKVSPFRLRISDCCTNCHQCSVNCRYDALTAEDIRTRQPGLSCTLCGDCIGSCKDRFITYRFPGLNPHHARTLFIILVVSIHAVCLGVARI